MTSYQIDNVILAAHCKLYCTVQYFSVCLDSGSGQCNIQSVFLVSLTNVSISQSLLSVYG